MEEKEEFGSQEDESLAQRDVKKGGVAAGDTQFVNEADLDDSLAALEAEEQRLAEQIRLEEKVQKFAEMKQRNELLKAKLAKSIAEGNAKAETMDCSDRVGQEETERNRPAPVKSKRGRGRGKALAARIAKPAPVVGQFQPPTHEEMLGKSVQKKDVNVAHLKGLSSLHTSADGVMSRLGLLQGYERDSHLQHPVDSLADTDDPAVTRVRRAGEYDNVNEYNCDFVQSNYGPHFRGPQPGMSRGKSLRQRASQQSRLYQMHENSDSSDAEISNLNTAVEQLNVGAQLKWPHEHLGARYNNYGKSELKFRNLDMRLLTAGELNICSSPAVSSRERKARLKLLGDVTFNSAYYQWQAILKFYAAVLSEVEQGNMQWGDDYARLEQQMLMPFPLVKVKVERKEAPVYKSRDSGASFKTGGEDRVIFCADYQKKTCAQSESHMGLFYGRTIKLHHICGNCYRHSDRKVHHPSSSVDCPNYEQ